MRLGVGIYERGKYVCKVKGLHTKEYKLWFAMLTRCYSKIYHDKEASYTDCEVSENFSNFQYFAEWCNRQIGFGLPEYQLDKDILVRGNKIYSEDNCVFVPREINNQFTLSGKARGEFPLGVYRDLTGRDLKPFKSVCKTYDKLNQKCLGRFDTPEEAFYAYKPAKEATIQYYANKWKDQIDPRAYAALMNYEVEITD